MTTTVNGNTVFTDDHDGVAMDLGKFNTRSFRQGRAVKLWIINDTNEDYRPKGVDVRGRTLGAAPTWIRWTQTADRRTGTANVIDADTISLNLPPKSVTLVHLPGIY